jgi:hypothetical protein
MPNIYIPKAALHKVYLLRKDFVLFRAKSSSTGWPILWSKALLASNTLDVQAKRVLEFWSIACDFGQNFTSVTIVCQKVVVRCLEIRFWKDIFRFL